MGLHFSSEYLAATGMRYERAMLPLSVGLFLVACATLVGCAPKGDIKDIAGSYTSGEGDKARTLTIDKVEIELRGKTGSEKALLMGTTCDKPGHCVSDSFVGKIDMKREDDKLTVTGGNFAGSYTLSR